MSHQQEFLYDEGLEENGKGIDQIKVKRMGIVMPLVENYELRHKKS